MAKIATALLSDTLPDGFDMAGDALYFVRNHLQMDVAFLAEQRSAGLDFLMINSPGYDHVFDTDSASRADIELLCRLVVEGDLPQALADTNHDRAAAQIPLIASLPIRSFVAVPIYRSDGRLFGLFCCLGRTPRPSLNERDVEVVRAFANMTGERIRAQRRKEDAAQQKKHAITEILDTSGYDIALQPIMCLQEERPAGYEALCRFQTQPYRPPNKWFDDAAEVGLQTALELNVIAGALHILPQLPDHAYLAINTSPQTLASGKIAALLDGVDAHRVVLEITEHGAIDDFDALLMEVDRLRELGVRIAVDDAGAGYSGLQQIVRLRPDVIKLDMSLTHDVDKDLARRSLTSAMVQFAQDTNAHVVAEGIETEEELRTLRKIGVEWGQGYHLARPAPAEAILSQARLDRMRLRRQQAQPRAARPRAI